MFLQQPNGYVGEMFHAFTNVQLIIMGIQDGSRQIPDDYSSNPDYHPYIHDIQDSHFLAPFSVAHNLLHLTPADLPVVLPNKLVKVTFEVSYDTRYGLSTRIQSILVLKYPGCDY